MKTIPLTKGYSATVDDQDYERVSQFNWNAALSKGKIYARRAQEPRGMHRFILGVGPEVEIDHRDRNTLNNQRDNLRPCTHAQNVRNVGPRKDNSSGYKGVTWDKENNKWRAQIGRVKLGRFSNVIEAAHAYDAKAKELYGEFAYLNFPENGEKP